MEQTKKKIAYFHLPGMCEFYELYRIFIPLFYRHREYFYDWCGIGSLYGAPNDCIWGGGRIEYSEHTLREVLALLEPYAISARLTFSNSQLRPEHLRDPRCNELCRQLAEESRVCNGVIVHSDLLAHHLRENYPALYLVSSTTKVLKEFHQLKQETARPEFRFVVPDFRLNPLTEPWGTLSEEQRGKIELLCNECCRFDCPDRKRCYETVSRQNLGEDCPDHRCTSPHAREGYRFSSAMKNPGFIRAEDIPNRWLPMGVSHFKIEGRGLGSALILEFLLYYMTKPEYHIHVREAIYLDNALDLF